MNVIPKPRWFRFSLRTLLLLFAVASAWLGWNAYQIRERELIKQFMISKGIILTPGQPDRPWKRLPIAWRLLRVESVKFIDMHNEFTHDDVDEIKHIREAFPEAEIGNFR